MKYLLFLFLVVSSCVCRADIAWKARSGYGVFDTISYGIVLQNSTASPVDVQLLANGVGSLAPVLTTSFTGLAGTYVWNQQSAGGAGTVSTVPANSSRMFKCSASVRFDSMEIGARSLVASIGYKIGLEAARVHTFPSIPITMTREGSPSLPLLTGSGSHTASGYTNVNVQSGLGTATIAILGVIPVGATPVTGTITVSGMTGPHQTAITLDGQVVAVSSSTTSNFEEASPPLVFTTQSPATYEGKEYKIHTNGRLVKSGIIELTDGNFAITARITGTEMPPSDPAVDYVSEFIPGQTSGSIDGPDASHDIGDPGPLEWDPGDNEPGPNGLTREQMYGAVRRGVQDALGATLDGSEGPARFDAREFARGAGTGSGALADSNGQGGQLASSLGGGVVAASGLGSALSSGSTIPAPGVGAGSSGLVFSTAWGNLTVGVHTWAPTIRSFATVFLSLWYCIAVFSIFRGMFTSNR